MDDEQPGQGKEGVAQLHFRQGQVEPQPVGGEPADRQGAEIVDEGHDAAGGQREIEKEHALIVRDDLGRRAILRQWQP